MNGKVAIEDLAVADFPLVASWLSNQEINKWLTSEWRDRDVTSMVIAMAVRNKRNRLFLIRYEGQACGLAALADIDSADRTAMIWYLLGEQRLGRRGITSAAVTLLAQRSFQEHDFLSLYAWAFEDNGSSRAVLKRAGFREAGRLRSAACSGGRYVDRVYYDLLRSEMNSAG